MLPGKHIGGVFNCLESVCLSETNDKNHKIEQIWLQATGRSKFVMKFVITCRRLLCAPAFLTKQNYCYNFNHKLWNQNLGKSD